MVDLEARVDAAIEANANREYGQRQGAIAARVRGGNQSQAGSILANAVDDLPGGRQREAVRADQPIRNHRNEHGEQPHGQVGQGAEQAVGLQGEA